MKICSKCGQEKELAQFSKKASCKDGLQPSCKECQKEYTQEYNTRNLEQVKERNRERYKEGGKERSRVYSKTPRGKYSRYKHSAKYTGRVFEFTETEFIETFWQKPCYYCGEDIDTVGVDRVDSTKGYSKDNCVSCCEDCNRMKMDRPVDVWLDKISKILKHLK